MQVITYAIQSATEIVITEVVCGMKNKISYGWDETSIMVIIHSIDLIKQPLKHIFSILFPVDFSR